MVEFDNKNAKKGFCIGLETLSPIRFNFCKKGIIFKYLNPFSSTHELGNLPSYCIGNTYKEFKNNKVTPNECYIFHYDLLMRKPVPYNLQPKIYQENQLLKNIVKQKDAVIAHLRKVIFNSSSRERWQDYAVTDAGFRKRVIEAGSTGAEQYGNMNNPFKPLSSLTSLSSNGGFK